MKITFKATSKEFNNGCYLLIPATKQDKILLNSFAETLGNRYATVTANFNRSKKTYDQCKTVFALIDVYFFLIKGRYPTEDEQALTYSKLLWKFAPRTEDPLDPNNTIPIPLSNMSKQQAAIFINSIMGEIYENLHGLTDYQEIELKELFEDFYAENGFGDNNPIDYDENGELLKEEKWREKNNFSFASGLQTEDLQLHHILTRGAHTGFRDEAWNWIMLTEEEHMEIIHAKGGWGKFLELFPHCAGRVKNAYDKAQELYPHEIQVALIKLGLLDEYVG